VPKPSRFAAGAGLSILVLLALALPLRADVTEAFPCDSTDGWVVLDRTGEKSGTRLESNGSALRFAYDRARGEFLVHRADLNGLRELRIKVRSETDISLALAMDDRDRASWVCAFPLPAHRWVEIRIDDPASQFKLNPDSPVRKDRLDPSRLKEGWGMIDVGATLEASGASGQNLILIDWIRIVRAPAVAPPRPEHHEWVVSTTSLPAMLPDFPAVPDGPKPAAVSDPSVLFDPADQKWKMWFAISWRVGESWRTAVKYSESADGVSWSVHPGTALEPASDSEAWDRAEVRAPTVVLCPEAPPERRYVLFYGGSDGSPEMHIGMALSAFGKRFTRLAAEESPHGKAGLILTAEDVLPGKASAAGRLADPEAVFAGGRFHLWCATTATGAQGSPTLRGIAYAASSDGVRWSPAAENPLPSLDTGEGEGSPHHPTVAWNEKRSIFEMWYGHHDGAPGSSPLAELGMPGSAPIPGYWYAQSGDGVAWTVASDERELSSELVRGVAGADVVLEAGVYRMWFPALTTSSPPTTWIGTASGK